MPRPRICAVPKRSNRSGGCQPNTDGHGREQRHRVHADGDQVDVLALGAAEQAVPHEPADQVGLHVEPARPSAAIASRRSSSSGNFGADLPDGGAHGATGPAGPAGREAARQRDRGERRAEPGTQEDRAQLGDDRRSHVMFVRGAVERRVGQSTDGSGKADAVV